MDNNTILMVYLTISAASLVIGWLLREVKHHMIDKPIIREKVRESLLRDVDTIVDDVFGGNETVLMRKHLENLIEVLSRHSKEMGNLRKHLQVETNFDADTAKNIMRKLLTVENENVILMTKEEVQIHTDMVMAIMENAATVKAELTSEMIRFKDDLEGIQDLIERERAALAKAEQNA